MVLAGNNNLYKCLEELEDNGLWEASEIKLTWEEYIISSNDKGKNSNVGLTTNGG